MAFLLALLLSFGPAFACALLLYWLDRYEKEPMILLGAVYTWGAVVAVAGAIAVQVVIEGVATGAGASEAGVDIAGSTILAPLIEESVKGFGVLLVFLVLRREFDSLLDGIIYASVAALGFAGTENFFYLLNASSTKGIPGLLNLFVTRVAVGIWDHPFYSALLGIGLAMSRLSRATLMRWLAPLLGWAGAVGFHIVHNSMATLAAKDGAFGSLLFLVDWLGWLFMAVVILFAISREGDLVRRQMEEEVEAGRLSGEQASIAASSWRRSLARFGAITAGRAGLTRRFYQVAGELAHKKEQLAKLGEDEGNVARIEELRGELATLAPQVAGTDLSDSETAT